MLTMHGNVMNLDKQLALARAVYDATGGNPLLNDALQGLAYLYAGAHENDKARIEYIARAVADVNGRPYKDIRETLASLYDGAGQS